MALKRTGFSVYEVTVSRLCGLITVIFGTHCISVAVVYCRLHHHETSPEVSDITAEQNAVVTDESICQLFHEPNRIANGMHC